MKFAYCPVCGTKLITRQMDDEGAMPYCDTCHRPRFDMFKTAVIGLVENDRGEVALIRQQTFSNRYESLVSGFVNTGEIAEDALEREIHEELGLGVSDIRPEGTHWFEPKGILMLGFFAKARGRAFHLTKEVDAAHWVPLAQALRLVHPAPAASQALVEHRLQERGVDPAALSPRPLRMPGLLHGNCTRLHPVSQPLAS